jgi:hypothetical protein
MYENEVQGRRGVRPPGRRTFLHKHPGSIPATLYFGNNFLLIRSCLRSAGYITFSVKFDQMNGERNKQQEGYERGGEKYNYSGGWHCKC